MSVQAHRVEFERCGVWRRVSALLIDVIAISAVLQLLAVVLFPASHGRVQFVGGLIYGTYCDKLEQVPDGASVPADFGANSITDCSQSLFGLTSARILRMAKVTRDGAITKEVWIVRMLDADGAPTAGLELDVLSLPLLLAMRFAFDRGRGSPGRRLCRIRLADAADGKAPSPAMMKRRYAVLLAALSPTLIWSLYGSFTTSSLEPTLLLSIQAAVGIPVLILAMQALYASFWRKDAWYDRVAGTGVLRVGKDGALIPTAAPLPPGLFESELSGVVPAELGAGASFSAASGVPPPLPPQGRQNYIARHWRGELSLPLSYWVNGTLGGLIAIFVTGVVGGITHGEGEAQPMVWLTSLCLVWLVIAVLASWQIIGIWRSATHYRQGGKRFWGGAAKVLMVLATLQVVASFFTVGSPQIAGMFEIVNGDSRVGPHQFRVLAYGEMLEFSGGITFGVAKEMEGFLDAMANVKTVRLNSIGGRLLEAQNMSDLIKARQLATLVEQDCVSACTIVFLGGNDRAITSNARLGFHQPAFRGMTPADRDAAIANEEQRLQGFGLSRAFAERANSAKPDSMWFPDKAELLREHVVTRVVTLKPSLPKTTAPLADTAPPANGAAANAAPAMPTAAAQPVEASPPRPDSNTPRVVIPPDVIKRLVDGPKPKPAGAAATATAK